MLCSIQQLDRTDRHKNPVIHFSYLITPFDDRRLMVHVVFLLSFGIAEKAKLRTPFS